MNPPLTVKSEAAADIVESAEWYDGQRAALGDEFLRAVDEVFERLREWPKLYAAGYRGVRQAGLKRFPYFVYYRVRPEGVVILAVMHGRRDPKSWRSRL